MKTEAAERVAKMRERRRRDGWKEVTVWVRSEDDAQTIKETARQLRESRH